MENFLTIPKDVPSKLQKTDINLSTLGTMRRNSAIVLNSNKETLQSNNTNNNVLDQLRRNSLQKLDKFFHGNTMKSDENFRGKTNRTYTSNMLEIDGKMLRLCNDDKKRKEWETNGHYNEELSLTNDERLSSSTTTEIKCSSKKCNSFTTFPTDIKKNYPTNSEVYVNRTNLNSSRNSSFNTNRHINDSRTNIVIPIVKVEQEENCLSTTQKNIGNRRKSICLSKLFSNTPNHTNNSHHSSNNISRRKVSSHSSSQTNLPYLNKRMKEWNIRRDLSVVLLGKDRSGKTTFVKKLVGQNNSNNSYTPTLEDNYNYKHQLPDKTVQSFNFIDTTGSDDFPVMRNLAIERGDCFILIYANNSLESFDYIQNTLRTLNEVKYSSSYPAILLSNKFIDSNKYEGKSLISHQPFITFSEANLNDCSLNSLKQIINILVLNYIKIIQNEQPNLLITHQRIDMNMNDGKSNDGQRRQNRRNSLKNHSKRNELQLSKHRSVTESPSDTNSSSLVDISTNDINENMLNQLNILNLIESYRMTISSNTLSPPNKNKNNHVTINKKELDKSADILSPSKHLMENKSDVKDVENKKFLKKFRSIAKRIGKNNQKNG
ncbi:hypothetical protein SNEBB_006706 [Seison nebaliae]|nr:hypothetical protein SNEBB_006706 [Seison nebaliae]